MTRGILLLLATLIIGVSAQAATPSSTYQTPSTPALATDDSDEDNEWSFWWEAGVNIASNYLWRGYDQSYSGNMFDPSLQPSVTLGFAVSSWCRSPT